MVNSQERHQLSITGFTAEGSGVARLEGLAVFIPGALPGEIVEAAISQRHKNFATGELLQVLTPSPQRVEPPCPVYAYCGGCLLQHASYAEQLALKKNIVSDALKRIAKIDVNVADTIGAPNCLGYRNRVSYHVNFDEKDIRLGFYSSRSRNFVSAPTCPLAAPPIAKLAKRLPEILQPYYSSLSPLREVVLRINSSGEQMLLTLVADQPLTHAAEMVKDICAAEPAIASVWECTGRPVFSIYGDKWRLLAGERFLAEQLCGVALQLSPATFTQVNPAQTEVLYRLVAEMAELDGTETVWDLYSGAGTIALYLAGYAASIIGVESYPPAVDDALRNAKLNGIGNCRFINGPAEKILPQLVQEGAAADLAVLDPPRAGCDSAVLEALLSAAPQRIIYVSCAPATLARDLRILCAGAYTIQRVQPVDMFPQTGHVESIVLLSKLHTKQTIEVELKMSEMDLTAAESKATYEEIKEYVLEKTGLKVSNLYIAQVKNKHGLKKRENYNLPRSEYAKRPRCPEEKEKAIEDALEHFGMI